MKNNASRLAVLALTACVGLLAAGCIGVPASSASYQNETAVQDQSGSQTGASGQEPAAGADATAVSAETPFANTETENSSTETMSSSQEISAFAGKIKNAVAASDQNALAGLCGYPVYISSPEGVGEEIKTKKELMALNPAQLFTDKLKADIAAVNETELEEYGAGVMMGRDGSIIFSRVSGSLMITGINP